MGDTLSRPSGLVVAALSCVCRTPGNRSNHSNPTRTQLRFRHGLRVRMAVRGFETFPNALGYTAPRGKVMRGGGEPSV